MSTLIAIAYPNARETSRQIRDEMIQRATKEKILELQDAVVVERPA